MKIEQTPSEPIRFRKTESTYAAGKTEAGHSTSETTRRDRAELSEHARLLARARSAYDAVPGADEERLAALREQVQNDTYQVPVEDLARALAARMKQRG